jgi:hypothetical protein
MMRTALFVCLLIVSPGANLPSADAQPRNRVAGRQASDVQTLFDAYALVQAQEALRLTDEQYAEFVTRLKSLQETRRRNLRTRARLLRELGQAASAGNDGAMREGLNRLREHDTRAAEELRQAYTGVDQVLDLRQQARFRVFEDRLEQRKFELMMRARQRQPNRPRPVPPQP